MYVAILRVRHLWGNEVQLTKVTRFNEESVKIKHV